jgi:hypothetical protein
MGQIDPHDHVLVRLAIRDLGAGLVGRRIAHEGERNTKRICQI